MDESVRQLQVLLDLDARHDDLLDQLDDLDKRVAQVLGEWMTGRSTPPAPPIATRESDGGGSTFQVN
jgi:hypothetical protein